MAVRLVGLERVWSENALDEIAIGLSFQLLRTFTRDCLQLAGPKHLTEFVSVIEVHELLLALNNHQFEQPVP